MRKQYIYIIILFISIIMIIYGIFYLINLAYKVNNSEENISKVEENTIEENTVLPTAVEENKVLPNTKFALKKYYDECNHFEYEEVKLPVELVNLTRQEVNDYYEDWEVEEFEKNNLVLAKEINGYCNQHFVIRLDDEKVNIYRLLANGDLSLYKNTEISAQYLPEQDIEKLRNGINIYGEGKLSSALEDLE